jgi:hypothetical protein
MLDYLAHSITITVTPPVPDTPTTLSPGEGFTFSFTATNAPTLPFPFPVPIPIPPVPQQAQTPIQLINVRYRITSLPLGFLQLIVPPTTLAIARSGPALTGRPLDPGSVVDEMYLVPADSAGLVLSPGEPFTLVGLRGKAIATGGAAVAVNILGDPDLDFLFAKNTNSVQGGALIQVA